MKGTRDKMKRNYKKIATKSALVIATVTMSAGVLTGCSLFKPNAEVLLGSCKKNMQKVENIDLDVDFSFDMEMAKEDASLTMEFDANKDVFFERENQEKFKLYEEMNVEVSMLGITQKSKTESYGLKENDTVTIFKKEDKETLWSKQEKDAKDKYGYTFDFTNISEQMTLEEETVTERNTECYVLQGDVKCKDIQFLFEDLGMETDDMEDMDAHLIIKVAKKEKLPISIEITMDAQDLVEDEELEESAGVSLAIKDFNIQIGLDGINLEREIEIPKETENAKEVELEDSNMFDFIDSADEDEYYGDEETFDEEEFQEDIEEEDTPEEDTPDDDILEDDNFDEESNLSESENYKFKEYIDKEEERVYLLIENSNNESLELMIDARFKKDGEIIDESTDILYLEAGREQVAAFYYEGDFDSVEYIYEELDSSYDEYIGSQIGGECKVLEDGTISGTVENRSDKDAEYVKANIIFYNSDGDVVGFESCYTDDDVVAAGETSSFETFTLEEDFSEIKVYVTALVKE